MNQTEFRDRMMALVQEAAKTFSTTQLYEVVSSVKQVIEVAFDMEAVKFLKEEEPKP